MKHIEMELPGVAVIVREPFQDERGTFGRVFCQKEFASWGLSGNFVQTSFSTNRQKGTLRGLHSLRSPYEEDKLIVCTNGKLFDVCVDVRENSPTFGKWHGEFLSKDNGKMLYIPKGFAHGFLTLEDNTDLLYCMTAFYQPDSERGYRYDEPRFAIDWPDVGNMIISQKDLSWGYL